MSILPLNIDHAPVLYVDDDPTYQLLVSQMLIKKLGIKIDLASSCDHAIEFLLRDHDYKVIVSDYSMPCKDGAELYDYVIRNEIPCAFILFTSVYIDKNLKDKFAGSIKPGFVAKTDLQMLCQLIENKI